MSRPIVHEYWCRGCCKTITRVGRKQDPYKSRCATSGKTEEMFWLRRVQTGHRSKG